MKNIIVLYRSLWSYNECTLCWHEQKQNIHCEDQNNIYKSDKCRN